MGITGEGTIVRRVASFDDAADAAPRLPSIRPDVDDVPVTDAETSEMNHGQVVHLVTTRAIETSEKTQNSVHLTSTDVSNNALRELPDTPALAYVKAVNEKIAQREASGGAWVLNLILPKSIRLKLMLAFTTMAVITGTIGAWSIWQIDVLGDINKKTYDRTVMAVNYARWANTEFERLANDALRGEIESNAANNVEDLKSDIFDNLDVAEKSATSSASAVDVQKLRALIKNWLTIRNSNKTRLKNPEFTALADQIRHGFEVLVEQNSADGFGQRALASGAEIYALRLSVVVTSCALALSILMTLILSRRVVKPLTAAANVAKKIASGELDTTIPRGGKDEAGALLSSMSVMQSRILEMMEAEAARRRSAQGRLIGALETLTSAMVLLDDKGIILVANSKVSEFLSVVDANVQIGVAYKEIFPPAETDWAALLSTPGEVLMPNERWLEVSQEQTIEGGTFLILRDITEAKGYERKLEFAAYWDQTTNLRNRAYLISQIRDEEPANVETASIILNIERFRQINNAHGDKIGDLVLKTVADRLVALISENDICARIGADEFEIWIANTSEQGLRSLLNSIDIELTRPVEIDDLKLEIKTRAGAAIAGPEATNIHDISRDARAALAHAKRLGSGRQEIFGENLRRESQLRTRIEKDLPRAIQRSEIYMDYQPLINTRTHKVGGFEALARWNHTELGQIPPMKFVSVAEETGSIIDLGMFTLHSAIEQATSWERAGKIDNQFTIAVNVSPRQITDTRNAARLLDYLDSLDGLAKRLKLEITESVLLENPIAMIDLLNAFKARGCELSLDDFGTGYSSLSYLHRFPFDVLKIDRSFVMNMDKDAEALRLVKTIVELGQDLELTIVAEGAETSEQANLLTSLGCDYIQGYYFSRPVGVVKAGDLLSDPKVWQ